MTSRLLLLSILCLSFVAESRAARSEIAKPAVTALIGGRLVDGTGRDAIENSVVVLRGKRIVAAGPQQSVRVPSDAAVIRVDGQTVMPGLIESNGHIIFSGQSNHAAYWAQRFDRYYEIGARNLYTNLMQGVTTVRDTMDPLDAMLKLREDSASGKIAASRVFTCGTILNYPGAYAIYGEGQKTESPEVQALRPEDIRRARDALELVIQDGEHGRQVVRQYARKGVDFIKVSAYSGPTNQPPVLSTAALRDIVDEAHKHRLPVTTHTMSVESVRSALDAGVDAMEHPTVIVDGQFRDSGFPQDVVERIIRQKVYSIPLLVASEVYVRYYERPERLDDPYYVQHAPADMVQEARQTVRHDLESMHNLGSPADFNFSRILQVSRGSLKKLIDAGAFIAMGTDKGTRLNFHESMNHVREMEIYVELGMSPMDAIVSATRRGAELLRKADELGTLEPGKLADVIVVEGNPLERISSLRKVRMVFKDGVRYK